MLSTCEGAGPWGQEADLYIPERWVIDMLGENSILLVRGGGHATVLIAGDAIVHSDWLRSNDVQRIVVNAERAAAVRNQVRAFADSVPDSVVVYGHDLRNIDCRRRDIVCHGAERFRPEAHDDPGPA